MVVSMNVLTPREIQIITGFAQGMTRREVAESLGIQPSTVKTLNEKIRTKLGAKNTAEAVAIFKEGIA